MRDGPAFGSTTRNSQGTTGASAKKYRATHQARAGTKVAWLLATPAVDEWTGDADMSAPPRISNAAFKSARHCRGLCVGLDVKAPLTVSTLSSIHCKRSARSGSSTRRSRADRPLPSPDTSRGESIRDLEIPSCLAPQGRQTRLRDGRPRRFRNVSTSGRKESTILAARK